MHKVFFFGLKLMKLTSRVTVTRNRAKVQNVFETVIDKHMVALIH